MKKTLLFTFVVLLFNAIQGQTPATALNFDGIDDYVSLNNQTQTFNYNASSTFTIEFWIKPGAQLISQTIIGKGSRTAGKGYIIRVVNNNISFRNRDVIIGNTAETAISPSGWTHVAVSYNASFVSIYIDGVLKKTGTLAISPLSPSTQNRMFIGARRADNGNSSFQQRHFMGSLDDLRIWSVVRTGPEIVGVKDCELSGIESGLVSYHTFNQGFHNQNNGTQTTLINTSNTLYNGTLNLFALNGLTSNFITSTNVLDSCSLGIESLNLEDEIKIFPNPSQGLVTLKTPGDLRSMSVIISDINGRIIQELDLLGSNDGNQLDLKHLKAGVYFVKISANGTSTIKKIIIQG